MADSRARAQTQHRRRRSRYLWPSLAAVLLAVVAVVVVVVVLGGDDAEAPGGSSADSGLTGGDFHSLVADPATPGRLFVGGHESVSMSEDGGRSWLRVASLDGADAMGWAFTPDATWVSGHPGINQSTDGALTFERRNDGLPDTDIHAFGAAGVSLIAAGPGAGTIASTDGGTTWQTLTHTRGQSFFGRIAADAAEPAHLVAADAAVGPVESRDGGRTWSTLTEFPVTWVSATEGLDTIVASGPSGAIHSTDAGATWHPIELPNGATLVEIDPHVPGRLFAGIHDGTSVTVQISDDNGNSWSAP
ncbi:MAG: hypothetical protein ACRDZZ_12275 [Ilumatobacteraceae bacterium]